MGRPRKEGERYACGKLKPQKARPRTEQEEVWSYEVSRRRVAMAGTVQAFLFHRKELTREQFETANWYELELAACRHTLKIPGGVQAISWWEIDRWPVEKIGKLTEASLEQFRKLTKVLDKAQKQALAMIECQVFDDRLLATLRSALDVISNYRARGFVDECA